jgi:protein-disulfide isomerase
LPTEPLVLDPAKTMGRPEARVGIVEFLDLECRACARFAQETLPRLEEAFIATGRVRFSVRHAPSPSNGLSAQAAIAAQCAAVQGRFWEMTSGLLAAPGFLTQERLQSSAVAAGLDMASWQACLDGDTRKAVGWEAVSARRLRLSGTPTFVVGAVDEEGRLHATRRFFGAHTFEIFEQAIAEAEASAKTTTAGGASASPNNGTTDAKEAR